jgi:peptidoglycan/xylan/chitin deacetylase (PgdA/CDA1 family)
LFSAGLLVAAIAMAAPPAVSAPAGPYPVAAASLTQDGQQLVWHVRLRVGFSAQSLQRGHRELCLLLERRMSGTAAAEVCVAPGRHGRGTALVSMRLGSRGPGPAHPLAATILRRGTAGLAARFDPSAVGLAYTPFRWQVLTGAPTIACASGTPCRLYFPSRPRLLALHPPRPVGCVPAMPYATNGARTQRVVALTFDDGPWPDTPEFLSILERNQVHATFFQIGRQVSTLGRVVDRRMLADGDFIGDHTWDHADVAGAGAHAAWEIRSTRAAIAAVSGFTPCLFRAPGGAVSSALIAEAHAMSFTTIGWDVDPQDWRRPGTPAILANVLGNVRNGSIVLQHDGGGDRSQTLAALPTEIRVLRARGYRFVTIPQLLGVRVIYK